jgi:uncharacterized membrane protein YgcG
MITIQKLKQSQDTKSTRAARTVAALQIIGTAAALKLCGLIDLKVQQTSLMLQKVSAEKGSVKLLAMQSRQAEQILLAAIKGFLGLAKLLKPELFNQLPTFDETTTTIDPDSFVEQMVKVFGHGDKQTRGWAVDLQDAKAKRLDDVRAWQEAVQSETNSREAKALQAETDKLLKEAEALILRNAKPGSPAYDVFTRKSPRKSTSSKEQTGSNGSGSSNGSTGSTSSSGSNGSSSATGTSGASSTSDNSGSTTSTGSTSTTAPASPTTPTAPTTPAQGSSSASGTGQSSSSSAPPTNSTSNAGTAPTPAPS